MKITFIELENLVYNKLISLGLTEDNSRIMTDIYISTTKRGVGHHDIHNLPQRIEKLEKGTINGNPEFRLTGAFGCMEQYDGDNGLGELINDFSMKRAMALASEHGIGMCTMRNSNHYLCSAPYVEMAAREGYIGFIIAKAMPTMGMPGLKGNLIGQSPIGYAYPTGNIDPVMQDICLAYVSYEKLQHMAMDHVPVPAHWGVDAQGNPTTDADALLHGTKYPIGEHKGFGLALLCELLTGVMSGGRILDESEEDRPGMTEMSHTAFAIKADALMSKEEFEKRSDILSERLKNRAEGIHIPGEASFAKTRMFEEAGEIELADELIARLR